MLVRRPIARSFTLLALVLLAACRRDGVGPQPVDGTHPARGEVDATLLLGGRPHGVAIARNGTFYISLIDGDAVMRGMVDSASQRFTGSTPVGDTPAHVAIDQLGTTAYTANQYGNTADVVDVASNARRGSIPLSDGGFNLLVSPNGARLYVTTAAGTLHVVNTATLNVIRTIDVGPAANGLAFDAGRGRLYVSSIFGNRVTAIDAVSNEVVQTYPVAHGPQRIAVSPDGGTVYIASQSVGLERLDVRSGEHVAAGGVPAGAVGLALSPDGTQLYVTNPPRGTVHIVSARSMAVIKVITGLASPRNVAFAARGTTAIVTGEGGRVYFIR